MFGRLGVALVFKSFLQKVEEQYQGKKIEFVSISVDNIKDREKWSNLVNKKLGEFNYWQIRIQFRVY
jgi:alkyl hydroperoxide reductase subunit AhpC